MRNAEYDGGNDVTQSLPDLPKFPADAITEPFDLLVQAMSNKLEREDSPGLRAYPAARSLLLALLRLSINTYRTIRFLIAEFPENPARKPEYVLSVPPLTRSILDALFTIVFLFGNLRERVDWYAKAGWKETLQEHERLSNEYADDPEWKEYLNAHKGLLNEVQTTANVTPEEVTDPSTVKRFPIPGQMIQESATDGDRQELLQYLYDWHYKVLSQDAHASLPGLARRATPLMPDFVDAPDRDWRLKKLRSDSLMASVTLLLAIVTELELQLKFGLSERIQYIWTIISNFSEDAKQLYERFYARYFRPPSNT